MKEVCDLDRRAQITAGASTACRRRTACCWGSATCALEIPSIDLVFDQPRALLGEAVHARFGDEFPIRFDFLDTMGGGNLSFQVHPLTEYIQQNFGMHYTQDESYYLLDAEPGRSVYLGLQDGVDPAAMLRDLETAQAGGPPFPAEKYANRWPAKKHDHFLIPAGTVHCCGRQSMVLEISATPYIFTFKMWDWGRMGLDGKPRPIHLQHGAGQHPMGSHDGVDAAATWSIASSRWPAATAGVRSGPACTSGNSSKPAGTGSRGPVMHDTYGGVNVLNLVAGEEAVVESPERAFEPFTVHYAETLIVPAAVGPYTIRPQNGTGMGDFATVKAFVRTGS